MINFILMLLGFAFPNSNANLQTNNNQNQTTIVQTNNTDSVDTGGETVLIPPKK